MGAIVDDHNPLTGKDLVLGTLSYFCNKNYYRFFCAKLHFMDAVLFSIDLNALQILSNQ